MTTPILRLKHFAHYLKPRPRDFQKYNAGSLLAIGGYRGYAGAIRMTAEAALRVGAGLVTVATHPEHANVCTMMRPEIMCHGVQSADELLTLCEKADVIVIGPGLARGAWSKALWDAVAMFDKPMVVDADALNLLAEHPKQNPRWILTPHPGEAARLLNTTTTEIQHNRVQAISQLQKKYQGVCVLKGHDSLVLGNDLTPMLCAAGNPGMATAGMGDVLTGVIGGLLTQGIPTADAAKLGVLIHAIAGDRAAKEGERGLLALDLMPHLRHLVNLK